MRGNSTEKRLVSNAAVIAVGAFAAKVIGAFYRIPLTNLLGSAGLGLYLSMGLARKMGGSLCAQNVSGAGAAFTFSFPIQTAKKAALASEAGPYRAQELAQRVAVEFSALPAPQAGGQA